MQTQELERRSDCRFTLADGEKDKPRSLAIFAPNEPALGAALSALAEVLDSQARVGEAYPGRVAGLKEFGAFVELPTGEQGLLHISEIAHGRTARVEDALKVEQAVQASVCSPSAGAAGWGGRAVLSGGGGGAQVMVLARDGGGNIKLSM